MVQAWDELVAAQEMVVARTQLLGRGMSPRQTRRNIDSRRWQVLRPGVYLTHSGPPSELSLVWAALLFCGNDGMAGGRTALWPAQAVPELGEPIEVCVPHPKPLRPADGIRIRQVRGPARRRAPVPGPPRLQLEHAILDLADRETQPERVCGLVLSPVQQRLLTGSAITAALAGRARHRWRKLLNDVLADFADGMQSPLERRYVTTVESAHGLPRAVRNLPGTDVHGHRRYRDVHYEPHHLIVELDGREAHPLEDAFRDLRRDNAVVLGGEAVLRYGWRDVAGRPCAVALQVATLLMAQGWSGRPTPCSLACTVASRTP